MHMYVCFSSTSSGERWLILYSSTDSIGTKPVLDACFDVDLLMMWIAFIYSITIVHFFTTFRICRSGVNFTIIVNREQLQLWRRTSAVHVLLLFSCLMRVAVVLVKALMEENGLEGEVGLRPIVNWRV